MKHIQTIGYIGLRLSSRFATRLGYTLPTDRPGWGLRVGGEMAIGDSHWLRTGAKL